MFDEEYQIYGRCPVCGWHYDWNDYHEFKTYDRIVVCDQCDGFYGKAVRTSRSSLFPIPLEEWDRNVQ